MFKNTRLVFTMHVGNQLGLGSEGVDSLKLELDETEYAFGMAYELEGGCGRETNEQSQLVASANY